MTDNPYLIDHGDWIALRSDDTEEPDSDHVGLYPTDYLSKEHFAGYTHLGDFRTDDDSQSGQDRLSVIQRDSDKALFGFEFWRGGGKYGEDYAESNPETVDYAFPEDPEELYPVWCVFKPVELYSIPAYRFKKESNDL